MSKPNREAQLQAGERRLQEWGLPADAGVAALSDFAGRDTAADLAIAARLGAHPDAASVTALRALETASRDKLVRKEVRRSLYRLEQRGVAVPPVPSAPVTALSAALALEGYLSAVDGHGDQLVWLVKARPGGLAHLFAVTNDPDGLREVELNDTTRKALRMVRQEMLDRHELRMIEADWRYCDFLVDRAFRWATEKGHTVTGDYRGLRAQLVKEPAVERPPLVLAIFDSDAVRREVQLVGESDQLLEEKEFRTWAFDAAALAPYLEELRQIRDSPLVLNPVQQQERFQAVAQRAVVDIFGGERSDSWVRRLEEMAYFLHATARPQQAKRALAAALALADSANGGREIALCEQLVRSSLVAHWQMEEQRRQEETRTSLVVTPQQAARELERRR